MIHGEVREMLERLQEYREVPVPKDDLLMALGVISEATSAFCDGNFARAMMTVHQAGSNLPKDSSVEVRKALHRAVQAFGGQETEFRQRSYAALKLLERIDPVSAGQARSLFEGAVRAEKVLVNAALDADAGDIQGMIRGLEELDELMTASTRQTAVPRFKVCLLGEGAVGKTSLIRRYVSDRFDSGYAETVGARVANKQVALEREDGRHRMTLCLWDIMGHEVLGRLRHSFLMGARGALLVVSLADRRSLQAAKLWTRSMESTVGSIPTVIAANKSDLPGNEVSLREVEEFGTSIGSGVVPTSAKTGDRVDEAFGALAQRIAEKT